MKFKQTNSFHQYIRQFWVVVAVVTTENIQRNNFGTVLNRILIRVCRFTNLTVMAQFSISSTFFMFLELEDEDIPV